MDQNFVAIRHLLKLMRGAEVVGCDEQTAVENEKHRKITIFSAGDRKSAKNAIEV
jgi:hypothetical protein